ncbi:MAG TPA: replication-relaxation family protein [Tepidisphaeraceae bacterium]
MPETTRRPSVELTERDLKLLRGLFECRVMTLAHAAVFYFGGSVEAATKRVQKLKAAGIVAERPRRVYEPSVLFLTKRAYALLHDRDVLADYPRLGWAVLEKRARVSELTLRHELAVMDVRAAFTQAIAADPRYELAEFATWPLLYRFCAAPGIGRRDVLVRPDGFIRVTEQMPDGTKAEEVFFLELDRSTEPQATLAAKAACYGDYYRPGGLAARNGRPRSEYKLFPFRVLVVCRNAERRNNAAQRMLLNNPPTLTQAWLTTFDELIADPLGAIWAQPADYRAAVAGTAFDGRPGKAPEAYFRQVEREMLVERSLRKLRLLDR